MSDTTFLGGGSDYNLATADNWSDGVPTVGNGKRAVFPTGNWTAYGAGGAMSWASAVFRELTNPPDLAGLVTIAAVELDGGSAKTLAGATTIIGNGLVYGGSLGAAAITASGGILSFDGTPTISSGQTITIKAGATLSRPASFVDGFAVPDANIGPNAATAQLVTDRAAVDAGKADILTTRTILTIRGTLSGGRPFSARVGS